MCVDEDSERWVKIITAILMLVDIVVGTFIFLNLIVAVAANTLVYHLVFSILTRLLYISLAI